MASGRAATVFFRDEEKVVPLKIAREENKDQ